MSWQERSYAGDEDPWRKLGRPGGDWQGLRPTFDNPMTWALPVGRISGITVRLHAVFLLLIVVWLIRASLDATPATMIPGLLLVGSLILMVLLHEFGHCLACRWVGGQANEILMWPLGGLAYTQPPHTWRANLVTTVGGPLVNVVFLAVTIPLLWLITGTFWGAAVPNPLDISAIGDLRIGKSIVRQALFALNYVNFVLLLFNLVPMFPLDGGRVLQELLWARCGYSRSMRIAVRVGYFGAIGMGLLGLIVANYWLVGIAFFGVVVFEGTPQQLRQTDDPIVRRFLAGQASSEELAAIREGASGPDRAVSAAEGMND